MYGLDFVILCIWNPFPEIWDANCTVVVELKAALEITDAKKKRTLAPKDEDQDHDLENANVHVAENVVVDRAHAIVLEDQDVIETISAFFFGSKFWN